MEPATAIDLGRNALWLALSISFPILAVGALVGLLLGVFQAITQIQEQTLPLVVKLIVMTLAVVWLLPWMTARLTEYSRALFEMIPETITPFL